jgi:orotidine-5'-phosphate decarboxylase
LQAKDRIILALDVDNEAKALRLVDALTPYVGVFKVGMQLYNSSGPAIVEKINNLGGKVFVDLKFHDIPNTVAAAGQVMARLKCYMFNVHAAGGKAMLESVSKNVREEAKILGYNAPIILAVTVLTSIGQQELKEEMLISGMKLEEVVVKWALMAKEAGINGVVCSPREITAIRAACGSDFKIVTPGIRPAWSEKNDQVRVTTPADALSMGADYMVIGRPILKAPDPVKAAQMIINELEAL